MSNMPTFCLPSGVIVKRLCNFLAALAPLCILTRSQAGEFDGI